MVHFFEIVSQEHCDRRNVVRAGCLLRWMDICACLSAEKHGQLSSVTLSMDDLSFDIPAVLGDVLEICATVNNAFNTSMEVRGRALTENTENAEVRIQGGIDSQMSMNLKPKVWTGNKKRLSIMLRENLNLSAVFPAGENSTVNRSMGESSLQMTKVVLPSDANHMGNTFGGNIMSWMDDAATVCAIKHIRHPSMKPETTVATIAVDSMAFIGPSHTGDRLNFYAQINRAFGTTIEVGIRVEAQAIGGNMRHINSGYLTIMAVDMQGRPTAVPKIKPENDKQKEQYMKAIGRRQLRMERKKLTGENKASQGLSWNWTPDMSSEISVANIYGLLKVANAWDLNWIVQDLPKDIKAMNKFELKMQVTKDTWGLGLATIRFSGIVSCKMIDMFKKLMECEARKDWDMAVRDCKVWSKIDEHNDIVWMAYPAGFGRKPGGEKGKPKDFSLLRTWRLDEERYIIASRSVNHPSLPINEDKERGEVFPSGFILTPWVMDDGMGDLRDNEYQEQTSFDYVVQLDKVGQEMAGFGNPESPYIKIMAGSLTKLCKTLSEL
ncbi:hypothetical protein TL16_g11987 [Triparma laevis f. inornata]|uniref:Acyl-CoA thioesterase n=1 Tax=Triparma laevis f. inornata TaxID=1714386 RepID=A0A9W7EVC0_9STRA|nr:hypothetical protein TL16_g11987 [Triparma laevis f. inornata]